MGSSGESIIEIAALGRPFQLGMVYDLPTDALIPGVTLWSPHEIQEMKTVVPKNSTEFYYKGSDTCNERSSSLKLDAHVQLSVMLNLIEVHGSAGFFKHTRKSQQCSSLTLNYHTTTRFEQLSMGKFPPLTVQDSTATHVVTGVLYGANAFFVFEKSLTKQDENQTIKGEVGVNLAKTLRKVTNIGGSGSADIKEEDKKYEDDLKCTFYGDFKLQSYPLTLEEAKEVYTKLPSMLGENGEYAVPVRVWLYPLWKMEPTKYKPIVGASDVQTTDIIRTVEEFDMIELRCNGLLNRTAATVCTLSARIRDFKKTCTDYDADLKKRLASSLVLMRRGEQEGKAIAEVLEQHEKSPFSTKQLSEWLKIKEQESDKIEGIIHKTGEVGIIKDDILQSSTDTDPFLAQLSEYFKCPEQHVATISPKPWLTDDIIQRIKNKKLQGQKDLHSECHEPDTVLFTPLKPVCSANGAVTHNSITVQLSPPCEATVVRKIEYKTKQEEKWRSQTVQEEDIWVTLSGLNPDTLYEIKCTAVGSPKSSVSSDVIAVQTLKVDSPKDLQAIKVTSSSVKLSWRCDMSDLVNEHIIEYRKKNDTLWFSSKVAGNVSEFTLVDLASNTSHVVRITSDYGHGISEPSDELLITTKRDWLKLFKDAIQKGSSPTGDSPSIYTLNMKSDGSENFSKYSLGVQSSPKQESKTIMLVGVTGSGKNTIINGMINYILGVEWEDDYRFKLINEVTNKTQGKSQTAEVTTYQIHHMDGFQIPYSLTIIDTPGFEDAKEMQQDQAISDQIKAFLLNQEEIVSIDAVCFVAKSSSHSLSYTQKNIFDLIVSLFGNDIQNNIVTLITFAEGHTPPVLKDIKSHNIKCARNADDSILHFKLNNSALFTPNKGPETDDNFCQMFWKFTNRNMEKFFSHLDTVQTMSLKRTKK